MSNHMERSLYLAITREDEVPIRKNHTKLKIFKLGNIMQAQSFILSRFENGTPIRNKMDVINCHIEVCPCNSFDTTITLHLVRYGVWK